MLLTVLNVFLNKNFIHEKVQNYKFFTFFLLSIIQIIVHNFTLFQYFVYRI
jgi:hypothetical protein